MKTIIGNENLFPAAGKGTGSVPGMDGKMWQCDEETGCEVCAAGNAKRRIRRVIGSKAKVKSNGGSQ